MQDYKKILIVEDDSNLSRTICRLLERRDRKIKMAASLERAFELIDHSNFDLILLDRQLPDGDGIDLISYIRTTSLKTKVIVLSSLISEKQRLAGLKLGADDYLTKPFNQEELFLKIKRWLDVDKRAQFQQLSAQSTQYYPDLGLVETEDESLQLRRRENQILSCLVRRKNRVVDRDTLIRYVWGTEELPANSTVDVYVRRLRMALTDKIEIKTVRGFGYMVADK